VGCQDNKTKQNQQQNLEKRILTEKENISSEKNQKEKDSVPPIKKLKQEELMPFLYEYGEENPQTRALIQTKFGDMEVELFEDTPLHRANFIYLTHLNYYNTTLFYRVDPGFVIQAGNSDKRETSRMRKSIGNFLIPKEFKAHHQHHYGALAAAKFTKQNVSKASSPFEFYIVMDKNGAHHLDNEHTVFGRVVKGMEVAEEISKAETEKGGEWPMQDIELKVKILN